MVFGTREWQIRGCVRQDLLPELNYTPVFKSLMQIRGFSDAASFKRFLTPSLGDLRDPHEMLGIHESAVRLADAVEANEAIGIFSDYDVDGVCSAALLYRFLVRLGQNPPAIFIPQRNLDGYGLSRRGIAELHAKGVKLLVSADCGINAFEAVEYAKELGMEVIITDHHEPEASLPLALSIVNPKQPACGFKGEDLCGAGVIFHLIVALRRELRSRGRMDLPNLRQDLDLVALATVADVVALSGQNRILVKEGLNVMNSAGCPGTTALARSAGIRHDILARDLNFALGPRLNAAGRMADAYKALDLLISEDFGRAFGLAGELDLLNRQRRIQEEKVLKTALTQVEAQTERCVLVVAAPGWNSGVTGIVAARLARRFAKPAIVIAVGEDGVCRGSGRSIEGLDFYAAVAEAGEMLMRFGGHRSAVGLTIASDRIEDFATELDSIIKRNPATPPERVTVDLKIGPLDLTPALMGELELLAPFGEGNPEPVFLIPRMEVIDRKRMDAGKVKFVLRHSGRTFQSLGCTVDEADVPRHVDAAFTPQRTRINGHAYLSLDLKALCPAD